MAGEPAEQKARLTQRRRDYDGKTTLQHSPSRLERRYCALAALPRGVQQQSRSGLETIHVWTKERRERISQLSTKRN